MLQNRVSRKVLLGIVFCAGVVIVWSLYDSSRLVLAAETAKPADDMKTLIDKFTCTPTCIERAEFYYLDFQTNTQLHATEKSLADGCDYRLEVKNPYLSEIGNFFQYNKLGPIRFGESDADSDFRLGARFYADGKEILSVFVPRSGASMKVNGKYYALDPYLISIVVEQLPPQAQQSILRTLWGRSSNR